MVESNLQAQLYYLLRYFLFTEKESCQFAELLKLQLLIFNNKRLLFYLALLYIISMRRRIKIAILNISGY